MITMTATNQLINEFLQQLGFSDTLWNDVSLTLSFEQSGTLHLEAIDRGLLIAFLKEVNEYEIASILPTALRLVHLDQSLPLLVQAGLKGDKQLVFTTTLSLQQLSLPSLNEATTVLEFLHQKITE